MSGKNYSWERERAAVEERERDVVRDSVPPRPAAEGDGLVTPLKRFSEITKPYWDGLRIDDMSVCEALHQAATRITELEKALEEIKDRGYGPDEDKAYHMASIARRALARASKGD